MRGNARTGLCRALVITVGFALACGNNSGDNKEPKTEPFFPTSYLSNYTEVRGCQESGDHDLNSVRILADPAALGPYVGRMDPFPEGAVVLKEEYEFGGTCEGQIKQWTVMQKLPEGSSPDILGWSWQRVDPDRNVLSENDNRCISCHQGCGVPPDGYDGTCAILQ